MVYFVSSDGVLTTPIGKELIDNFIIKLSDLKDTSAMLGYVTLIVYEGHFVSSYKFLFSVIKETLHAETYAKNI